MKKKSAKPILGSIFLILSFALLTLYCFNPSSKVSVEDPMPPVEQGHPIASIINENIDEFNKPNFAEIRDVKEKKNAFFSYMYPFTQKANLKILQQRIELEQTVKTKGAHLSPSAHAQLLKRCNNLLGLCQKKDIALIAKELLKHTDIIPPSLALAQAANESSWGTSRFALKGNNYFGQWCFKKGCGLVPLRRNSGSQHEVRTFDSTFDSVVSYSHNINSGKAYAQLRKLREELRGKGEIIYGNVLAQGLQKYSERGIAYVKEIQNMIKTNNLTKYDKLLWSSINKPST